MEKAGYRTARIGKYHVGPEQVFRFQQVLQGAVVDDPNSIGRSLVLMADLCNDFIKDSSAQLVGEKGIRIKLRIIDLRSKVFIIYRFELIAPIKEGSFPGSEKYLFNNRISNAIINDFNLPAL